MSIIYRLTSGHAGIEIRKCVLALVATSAAIVYSAGCGPLLAVPHIEVDPQALYFEAVMGGEAPPAQLFAVTCETDDPDYYYRDCDAVITHDQPWIMVDKTIVEHFGTVNVTVNTDGLVPGTYTGRINARNEQVAFDDDKRVDITLVISAVPAE